MFAPIPFLLIAASLFHPKGVRGLCPPQTPKSAKYCGAPGWAAFSDSCYKVFTGYMNFEKGSRTCHLFGSEVASVHSADENNFIANLITEELHVCKGYCQKMPMDDVPVPKRGAEFQPRLRSFWLGMVRKVIDPPTKVQKTKGKGPMANTIWTDGSPADFANEPHSNTLDQLGHGHDRIYPWSIGQPSGYTNYSNGVPEPCVHIWTVEGYWNDIVCQAPLAGVVCKKAAKCD